jgi:ubiquitin carboxyl-terminal hydrolase L5
MARDIQIMRMSKEELIGPWEQCIKNALSIKTSAEDKLEKPLFANISPFRRLHYTPTHGACQTENIKRTFDFEPFIKEFIRGCQREGKLTPFLKRKKSRPGAQ